MASSREVAERLGVTKQTVYKLMNDPRFPVTLNMVCLSGCWTDSAYG
jgi:predicted DNA-binding transcriptional regulator AlpA